jgi:PAS domain S-box-containing protein/putative nucleotidyltransferase with HDIG domain
LLKSPPEANPFPMLIMTSHGDEKTAVEAIKGGALDYIVKSPETIRDMPHIVARALHHWQLLQEHQQAEKTIEKQREEYRTIYDTVRHMIVYLTKDGTIQRINRAGATFFGLEPREIVGKTVYDFLPADEADQFTAVNNEVISSGEAKLAIIQEYSRLSGKTRWAQIDRIPYLDERGDIIGVITLHVDITRRKLAEEGLKHSLASLEKTLDDAIGAMSKIVEMKDPFTAGHQIRVAQLAIAMAEKMKLTDEQVGYIKTAATVHDIGKIYVPSDILSKPGTLRDMEMQIIRTHAQGSYEILRKIDFHGPMAQIAYQHHERLDGSGYPRGLKGGDIILEAKILAVADVVEAMASHRPYRAALGIDKALEEIRINRGSKYDEAAVDACLELFNGGKFEFKPV